jgi:hypothetical protein
MTTPIERRPTWRQPALIITAIVGSIAAMPAGIITGQWWQHLTAAQRLLGGRIAGLMAFAVVAGVWMWRRKR